MYTTIYRLNTNKSFSWVNNYKIKTDPWVQNNRCWPRKSISVTEFYQTKLNYTIYSMYLAKGSAIEIWDVKSLLATPIAYINMYTYINYLLGTREYEILRYRKLKFRFRAIQLPTLALRRFSTKHTNVYCRKIVSLLMTSLCRLSSLLSIDHHHHVLR